MRRSCVIPVFAPYTEPILAIHFGSSLLARGLTSVCAIQKFSEPMILLNKFERIDKNKYNY